MIDQTEQVIREEVALMGEVGENGHDQPSHYVVHLPCFRRTS